MIDVVGAVDLGGTHVTAALVDVHRHVLMAETVYTLPVDAHGDADHVLDTIAAAIRRAGPTTGRWGLAVPGPFDYAKGVARYHDVGKFDALDGTDVRGALVDRLGDVDLTFGNDADAFLRGEWVAGSARGHDRCVGLTFGTGVGSAFMVGGRIAESGPGVPPEGRVDLLTYRDRPLEETFSRRALLHAYGEPGLDVKELVARAEADEPRARRIIDTATAALGETLGPWLAAFEPTALVVGGAISGAWHVFEPSLTDAFADVTSLRHVAPTTLGDTAPLLGAAHATTEEETCRRSRPSTW